MERLHQLVTFCLDRHRFSLHLSDVRRVIQAVEITALPGAPDAVSGIINVQGEIMPVFNIRKRFCLPEKDTELSDQMIIASAAKRTVALSVDSVDDVAEIADNQIIPAERILPELEYVEGVEKTAGGMILIHDIGRFLSLAEAKELDEAMETLNQNERQER